MMAAFAAATDLPTLFVSYDELVRDMERGIDSIARFCGVAAPDMGAVIDQLNENHLAYLGATYQPRVRTALDGRLSRICVEAGVSAPGNATP
ncbi:hypothetical protein ASG17_10535 [Brevundimonas sp. Leaf363]|nr:hypothetical protein ASG17_10535 [Brevundimonas sp. Leaf363]